MRTKKKDTDYSAISRRSVKRDFKMIPTYYRTEKRPQIENSPEISSLRRIQLVGEHSSYYKLRSYLVGKLVRLVEQTSIGAWYCEFVYDEDRKALNRAAGWSDNKDRYLLDSVRFRA